MAFSSRATKPKAAPAPPPREEAGEDSDEVESVEAEEDGAARKKEEAEKLRKMKEVEEEAKRAREATEARDKERKAAEEAARQKAQAEAAKRREAAEESRRKAEEDLRRKEEYEYEKARQETISRSKKEAARRAGGGGFGGGGFGGGGGGGSFAWKKSGAAQGGGAGGGSVQKTDARRSDQPSHDECEMGISAIISRTHNGMKEGLQMLGLPNFPLTFIPGQCLVLCGHDVREGFNEMIHNWMTDEKDDFFSCLAQLKDITSKPILTQEEMEMMDKQEDWVQIDGPDGKPRFTKRDPTAKKDGPPAAKPAIAPQPADDDSGDEVIDIVPGGPIPTSTPAPPPAPAVRPAPAATAAPAAGAEEDYYALLAVAPDASLQEIRTKFRSLVVTEHPEKGGDPKKFQKLNKAYSVLSDQKKRQEYDASRSSAAARPKKFVD